MDSLLSAFLNLLALYGYPIVVGTIFVGYMGIPVPSEGVLMAAGALSVGDDSLNFYGLIIISASTAILGDVVAYYIGKKYGHLFIKKYGHFIGVKETLVTDLSKFLDKWGMGALFITRWLLTPLGIPFSLLSGITKFPLSRFLISVSIGEFFWVSIFIYIGYLLRENWLALYTYFNNFFWLIVLLSLGIVSTWLGLRLYRSRTS